MFPGKQGATHLKTSAVQNVAQKMISSSLMLENSDAPFDQAQKNVLGSKFVAYRKIQQGNENLPLAVIVRLLDYCFANSKSELFYKLHQTLYIYNYHFLENSQGVLALMQRISEILYANTEIYYKMSLMEEIYNNQGKDLEMIMRNLVKIVTKLNYYRKSITASLNLRPIQTLELIFKGGLLDLNDFLLFLITSEIQLKVIDTATMRTMSYGNRPLNNIYLIKAIDGLYYPIITSDEHYEMNLSRQEYLEMNEFSQNKNIRESEVPIENLNEIKTEISNTEPKTNVFMGILKEFYKGLNISNSFNDLRVMLNDSNLESTVENFCCNQCSKFENTAEFPCGHMLCSTCSNARYDASYIYCSLCNFAATKEAIDKYFQ